MAKSDFWLLVLGLGPWEYRVADRVGEADDADSADGGAKRAKACGGFMEDEDAEELRIFFQNKAKDCHGDSIDLTSLPDSPSSFPLSSAPRACGGLMSDEDWQAQLALFHSLTRIVHGTNIDLTKENSLEEELAGMMGEAEAAGIRIARGPQAAAGLDDSQASNMEEWEEQDDE